MKHHQLNRMSAAITVRRCAIALAVAALGTPLLASAQTGAKGARDTYRQERAACMAGNTSQSRADCLYEARSVLRDALRGELQTPDADTLARNAAARCDGVPQDARDSCARIARGEGEHEGSVAQGGVVMWLAEAAPTPVAQTTSTTIDATPMQTAQAPTGYQSQSQWQPQAQAQPQAQSQSQPQSQAQLQPESQSQQPMADTSSAPATTTDSSASSMTTATQPAPYAAAPTYSSSPSTTSATSTTDPMSNSSSSTTMPSATPAQNTLPTPSTTMQAPQPQTSAPVAPQQP